MPAAALGRVIGLQRGGPAAPAVQGAKLGQLEISSEVGSGSERGGWVSAFVTHEALRAAAE